MIGKTVGHYKILSKLGEGGMGVVYEAEDSKLGRKVALKFLPAGTLADDAERARFLNEARAAASLQHPNICTVYQIDEVEGETFISMAHMPCGNLRQKIERGPIDLDEAVTIGIQVARGL